jgi:hypothetical protein
MFSKMTLALGAGCCCKSCVFFLANLFAKPLAIRKASCLNRTFLAAGTQGTLLRQAGLTQRLTGTGIKPGGTPHGQQERSYTRPAFGRLDDGIDEQQHNSFDRHRWRAQWAASRSAAGSYAASATNATAGADAGLAQRLC